MAEETETTTPSRETEENRPPVVSDRDLRWRQFRAGNPRLRMFMIIGLVVALVAGFFLWRYFSSYESTDDAQIDGHLNPVSARVGGHVLKVLVDDNQEVKAGQPLVQIDPRDYQVLVDRAKAEYDDAVATAQAARVNVPISSTSTSSQLSAAKAGVAESEAARATAQQQYDAANAQLAQAEANNVKAQNDLARYKQLISKQEISQQQYDQAYAAAQASSAVVDATRAAAAAAQHQIKAFESRVEGAQANLESARTGPEQVRVMRARAQSAEATVEAKKAALEQARLNLQYTTITAPVNGVVTDKSVDVGQNIQPGQGLMRIINLDDIWVTANFKETQLRDMRIHQAATIHVDTTGKDYKGHVQSIAGASGAITSLLPPENATGNFVKVVQRIPVKITFDPGETKQHVLRPGMSVEPKVWIR
jgi:membrane fusion protein, multidrug efflux system